jgi:hypothetical protein
LAEIFGGGKDEVYMQSSGYCAPGSFRGHWTQGQVVVDRLPLHYSRLPQGKIASEGGGERS